jgi:hypothetical protein
MSMLTMLEIARREASDDLVGIIEDVTTSAPELSVLPGDVRMGTSYKIATRTAQPGSSFASAGGGWTPAASSYASKLVQFYNFGTVLHVPKSIAMADEKGVADVLQSEVFGALQGAMINLGSQVYGGTTVDSSGFPGLKEIITAFGITALTIDAGGTTADTGSSVYMVNASQQGVRMCYGMGSAITMSPWTEQQIVDPNAATKYIPSYVSSLNAWIGMQAGHAYCAGRIKDLTEDSGKGLTWALMNQLWSEFPQIMKPTHIFMNRRSERQLRNNTTVTINAGPQGGPALSLPTYGASLNGTMWEGAQIVVTDSITSTETLT